MSDRLPASRRIALIAVAAPVLALLAASHLRGEDAADSSALALKDASPPSIGASPPNTTTWRSCISTCTPTPNCRSTRSTRPLDWPRS